MSGRRRRRRGGMLALVIAAVALGVLLWQWKGSNPRPPAPPELPAAVLSDSLRAAMSRGEWTRGLAFAERLARSQPRNSSAIRNLAVMLHNRAVAQTVRYGTPHPALRTSLDRIETEFRVLALLDSATALARTSDEWSRARQWYGQAHERLGLPLDAYLVFAEIRARDPSFTTALARMIWVNRLLRDPRTPDPERER